MNSLTEDSLFGTAFFTSNNLKSLDIEEYFSCLNLLQPFLKSSDFVGSTEGFYINYINSVRLSYFINDKVKVIEIIKDFLNRNIALSLSRSLEEPKPDKVSVDYGDHELRFRKFLNTYTQIGLDLLDYDTLYSRRLVAEYRLIYSRQKIPCRSLFEPSFRKHSEFFNNLDNLSVEQLWKDLDYWYPIGNGYVADWAHLLVNMLLPGDWMTDYDCFKYLFINPKP